MGSDDKQVNTVQNSTTNPYAPSIPLLNNILSSLGSIGTGETGAQAGALDLLSREASGIPDMSAGETGAVNNALGFNNSAAKGLLSDAYGNLKTNIGATASGAELDPYKTPGFSDALATMTNDIRNTVGSTYAGSGRDPSGAGSFAGSLARGLVQGEAPVIANQFNQNKQNQLNSANTLFNAGTTTGGNLNNLDLSALGAQFQGLQGAGMLPSLLTAPGAARLGVANTAYGQPISNITSILNPTATIAGLGGSSTGESRQDTTQSKSLLSNIIGGAAGLGGLNGALGSGWLSGLGSSLGSGIFNALGPAAGFLAFSDERVKEDIEPVGETHDGQTLYSYRYIGDPEPRVGLLAQEVEKRDPGAVVEIDGIKAVNYPRALAKSRRIGMLQMEEAA